MNNQAVGAASPLHLRAKVLEIQSWVRQYVGEGVRINLEWSRTGAQTFQLLGGDRTVWTTQNIFGRHGEFKASAPQSMLVIDEPSLRYAVQGHDVVYDSHFIHRGGADRISPASCSDSVSAGDDPTQVVGAIGLMGVVSILSFVWQLLHPRVSLEIPGEVGCQILLTGDVLSVDLLKPLPMVRVQMIMELAAGLSRVTVKPDLIESFFVGSILKYRKFELV